MSEKKIKRYLVTSALPYANGPLHIGHLTGAYLSADVFVRFLRSYGEDVLWVCGSDEHGAAITIRAMKEGLKPQEIIDKYDALFRSDFSGMGISFDIFHRTSAPIHYKTSQDIFRVLNNKGAFDVLESEQYFDTEKNTFLADRYIIGVCPVCGNPDAYGDQCERCGSTLSPNDLLPPIRSTLSGNFPTKKPTKHWYLKLDAYNELLKRWMNTGDLEMPDGKIKHTHAPTDWKAHVLGQCNSWLETGLQPRAMTRDLDWGIPVPEEIDASGLKKLYVWLDAPIGYISATKQWAIDNGDATAWEKYWKDDETALLHFIGKDNIVFHALIFPAILYAHGGFILPYNVPANQFMNLEGRKMSTSKNWAIWVNEYLSQFPDQVDALRYNLVKNMPEQQDSEFTWKRFQESNNNELVANLANFFQRATVLVQKHYNGNVPDFKTDVQFISPLHNSLSITQSDFLKLLAEEVDKIETCIRAFDFRGGLTQVMQIASFGNQLLQMNEPWKRFVTHPDQTATVLNLSIQLCGVLSVITEPFIPFTSKKMRELLNISPQKQNGEWLEMKNCLKAGKSIIDIGTQLAQPQHLFSRITDEVIDAQIAALYANDMETITLSQPSAIVEQLQEKVVTETISPIAEHEPLKPEISYDDFAKMDIRTATILAAERVPKADKLIKLTVDLGFEQRTIVSGIAEHFDVEKLVGQRVIVLANLASRKLRGIESAGMILLAENSDHVLKFVFTEDTFQNGAIVK